MNNADAIATYQRWIRYSSATIADMVELAEALQRRGYGGSAEMLQDRISAAIGQQKVWEQALACAQRVAS
jgi:hypothetical protein